MATILLVGGDTALLEGLSQSLGALGHQPKTVLTLHEAREHAAQEPPLIVIAERQLAAESASDTLSIPLAAGGAVVLYGTMAALPVSLAPCMQRSVLADLRLPLERKRLIALVQHVEERARAAGRGRQEISAQHHVYGSDGHSGSPLAGERGPG